jgi:hypothetical protein
MYKKELTRSTMSTNPYCLICSKIHDKMRKDIKNCVQKFWVRKIVFFFIFFIRTRTYKTKYYSNIRRFWLLHSQAQSPLLHVAPVIPNPLPHYPDPSLPVCPLTALPPWLDSWFVCFTSLSLHGIIISQ